MADTKPKEFVLGFREPKEGEPPGLIPYCDPPDEKFLKKVQSFAAYVKPDPIHRKWEVRIQLKDLKASAKGTTLSALVEGSLRVIAALGAKIVQRNVVTNEYIKLKAHEMLCESFLQKLHDVRPPLEVHVTCDTEDKSITMNSDGTHLTIRVPNVAKTELWHAWTEEHRRFIVRRMALSVLDAHGLGTPA